MPDEGLTDRGGGAAARGELRAWHQQDRVERRLGALRLIRSGSLPILVESTEDFHCLAWPLVKILFQGVSIF